LQVLLWRVVFHLPYLSWKWQWQQPAAAVCFIQLNSVSSQVPSFKFQVFQV
jgi:hypothetical protein